MRKIVSNLQLEIIPDLGMCLSSFGECVSEELNSRNEASCG